jgi:hypothetical protein
MPGQRPQPQRRAGGRKRVKPPAAVAEFVHLLGQIHPSEAASRLQLDMARDAGLEVFRKLLHQIERLRGKLDRARLKRHIAQDRQLGLLQALAAAGVVLPRPAGLPAVGQEELETTFRELGDRDFAELAQALHQAAGQSDILAYRRFLVEEVLVQSYFILVEHLVRKAARGRGEVNEDRFLEDLRHHLAGKVYRKLARQTGYQITPDVGGQFDALLVRSLRFLDDLLTSQPPGRLILPALGSDFDPNQHEPIAGRPDTGTLIVRATIFPGYVVLSDPPRVVARARVYTKQIAHSPDV